MSLALDILDRLIAFPTVSRDGNIDLIRYVANLLESHGIAARLFPAAEGDRASLFATVGPEGAGGVVLSGHTDVVPVDGQAWTSDPFRLIRRDDRLYGRGTTDMKGFVACAIEALVAAKGRPLARPLHLALSYDEEIGCVGVRPMLTELATAGLKPDWVLIGEPTEMQVAVGHKGKTNIRATCRGHAAHSALAPTGLNAIHLAADLLTQIRALQAEIVETGLRDDDYDIPYTTLHAGIIRGGTALNIVPDACVMDFEIRNLAGDEPKVLLDRLFAGAEAIGEAQRARFPETGISLEVFNTYPGLDTAKQSETASRAMALSGNGMIKVAFGTEGGLFRDHLDVPVVVCGPGSMEQGHKPDEYMSLSQLDACRQMLARLADSLST
jgi:acetylornithine deacetylase